MGFRRRSTPPTTTTWAGGWGIFWGLRPPATGQDAAELVREGGRAWDTMDPWQTEAGRSLTIAQ